MRLESHYRLGQPVSIPSTRVVVYDDMENPIALVVKLDDGQYFAAHVDDDDFQDALVSLGINRTVVVRQVRPKPRST